MPRGKGNYFYHSCVETLLVIRGDASAMKQQVSLNPTCCSGSGVNPADARIFIGERLHNPSYITEMQVVGPPPPSGVQVTPSLLFLSACLYAHCRRNSFLSILRSSFQICQGFI